VDFLNYNGRPDIIVSNPPFSIIERVLEKCYELRPRMISFLLQMHNITPHRLRRANEMGYFVYDYTLCRVDRWFGISVILTLSREINDNVIGFDISKHKMVDVPREVEIEREDCQCNLI